MTTNTKFVQTPAVALYTGISAVATSARITPYPVDLDGVKLTMSDFGTTGFLTIDPKVSGFEEIASFTGIVDNGDGTGTLTGLIRDLQSKYPYTGSGTGKIHGSSAIVVFSDNPQLYNKFPARDNDETITGQWTFTTFPITPATPLATNLAAGFTLLSVAAANPLIPKVVGDNDVRVPSANPTTLFAPISLSSKIHFGGTGSDGAAVFDGTTAVAGVTPVSNVYTFNLGSALVYVKNFTSITMSGTASIVFTSPHANGTTVIFKSQGNVTLASSTVPAIDLRLMGAAAGAGSGSSGGVEGGGGASAINGGGNGAVNAGTGTPTAGNNAYLLDGRVINGGNAGTSGGAQPLPNGLTPGISGKVLLLGPGAGGAGNTSGTSGGRGGGAFYIECAGTFNSTITVNLSGQSVGGVGSRTAGSGGGGCMLVLYGAIGVDSGTYTVVGGSSTGGVSNPNGGTGYYLATLNTEF